MLRFAAVLVFDATGGTLKILRQDTKVEGRNMPLSGLMSAKGDPCRPSFSAVDGKIAIVGTLN
jgi:hypothetical protein